MELLEQEIIEKYRSLDSEARVRVKQAINQDESKPESNASGKLDFDQWLKQVEAIRAQILANNGGVWPIPPGSSLEILRQIRDGEDENW